MMRWIVGSSLKFRRLLVGVAAGVMLLGFTQLGKSSVDALPEFTPTIVEVQTEALGLSASEVEQLVTVPIEQQLLIGVAFLEKIESVSLPGLSSIVMTFEPGTDVLDARQVVQERLTQGLGVGGLPHVAKLPQMLQPLSSTSRVAMVKLSSEELSLIELSVLARWVITPRLLGVDGVANVAVWGQRERQLQVLVHPERLRRHDLTLQDIIRTAGNALEVSPLSFLEASTPGTGGFIDTLNQRLQIFHEQAISTEEELAEVAVEDREGRAVFVRGRPLTLGDVTRVVEDHQPLIGDALCREGECLLLVVEKFPGANTSEVSREVERALEVMGPGLPGVRFDSSVYRPASYIETSFSNLGMALLIGALLLLLLMALLFFGWRSVVIAALVIPLSVVVAGLVLYLRDATINTMVLAGLVMALVVVIDDAVSDVDNVARRVRKHRMKPDGAPLWRIVLEASLEMRKSLLYGTLAALVPLVPLLFLDGVAGAFLPPLALSYVLAVAASMVVALTITPALSMILLPPVSGKHRESPAVLWLGRRYDRFAPRLVTERLPALVVAGILLLSGLAAVPFLGLSLRPSLKESDVLIRVESAPGTSLPLMNQITDQAVRQLEALPGVQSVSAHVGRAVTSDQVVNVNSGEIWVRVDPSAGYEATVDSIERIVAGFGGLSMDVLTYSEKRVGDVLQERDEDFVIRIYGEDPEVLRSKAEEVRSLLAGIEGVQGPQVHLPPEEPTLEVEVDLTRAQAVGVKPGDVRRAAASLLSGITVGHLFEQQKVFDVVVWGAPEIRESERDIRSLLIDTPGGGHVRLGRVADVRMVPNPTVIRHESASPYLDVSSAVAGRDLDAVTADVERALEQVDFPLEHHAEVLGGAGEGDGGVGMLAVVLAAGLGMFLLLQAAFNSWRLATILFLLLPLSLAGGAVAALVAGATISLGSVAGSNAVLGIAARTGVVLIRHYQELEHEDGRSFGPELVIKGTRDRLAPMLMVTLGAALVLLPLVVAGDRPGLEVVRPMAVVILGGLITSTLLNLLVVPATYLFYGRVAESDASRDELVTTIPDVTLTDEGLERR